MTMLFFEKQMLAQLALFALILSNAESKKKYALDVESVEVCPNNDKLPIPLKNLKFVHYNRTHKLLSFDYGYDRPLDKTIGGGISSERWTSGGWAGIPFIGFQADACNKLHTFFSYYWKEFNVYSGIANPDKCPIPAGNYSLKNLPIHLDGGVFLVWPGRYRTTSLFKDSKTGDILYCFIVIVSIKETM